MLMYTTHYCAIGSAGPQVFIPAMLCQREHRPKGLQHNYQWEHWPEGLQHICQWEHQP
jgi:hypothetical protein